MSASSSQAVSGVDISGDDNPWIVPVVLIVAVVAALFLFRKKSS